MKRLKMVERCGNRQGGRLKFIEQGEESMFQRLFFWPYQFLLIDALCILGFSTNGHLILPKSSF